MFTLTKWIAAPIVAIGLMYAADAPTAAAEHGCYRGGGLSLSFGGSRYGTYRPAYGNLYRSNYGYGLGGSHYGNYRSYGARYGGGHYDYHPTEVYRHGNHLHVQPAHFDWHGGGHHGHHGHH